MKLIVILPLLVFSLYAKVINFSPLPMDKAPNLYTQYSIMLGYLEMETGYKFNFVYSSSYKELIQNFKDGKIDIIELGALPYVRLKEQFDNAYPFLTFHSQDGKPYYSCDMVTTEKNINQFKDIVHSVDIFLTAPLSTCGYLMSEYMMKKHSDTLENFHYEYVETHSNVLLKLLLKNNSVGVVKSTVLDKYKQFDFKTLEKSVNIPGFSLVANTNTVTQKEMQKIQEVITKLDPNHRPKDRQIVTRWSENTKYGASKAEQNAYDTVIDLLKKIQIPKEKN